jgi:hypothetical protein
MAGNRFPSFRGPRRPPPNASRIGTIAMPLELQIIRAAEFLRMGPKGEFDMVASCAVLAQLAKACRMRGMDRALLDVRKATAPLAPKELAALVNIFHEIGFMRNQRLAILHSGDPYRRARTFALISRMRGWKVRAFGDFEEAMAWLSSEKEQASKTHSLAKHLPVAGAHATPAHVHQDFAGVIHAPKRRRVPPHALPLRDNRHN